jgi:hypothetical protein
MKSVEKKMLPCEVCGKGFANAFTLRRHQCHSHQVKIEKMPEEKGFLCEECGKQYSTRWNLHVHQSRKHHDEVAEQLVVAMKQKNVEEHKGKFVVFKKFYHVKISLYSFF